MSKKPNDDKVEAPNEGGDAAIIERLKGAIDKAGGAASVSRLSGVPMSTLSNYLNGTEPRFGRMAALARACQVSLEWLATGAESENASLNIPFLSPANLRERAHFWGLFVLLRSCQEYHEQMRLRPTLAEVFEWIGPPYEKAKNLPDSRIDFKPMEGGLI